MQGKDKRIPEINPDEIDSRDRARRAVRELREAVRYHDHRYYALDDPFISDREYDGLFETLRALEERWDIVSSDSPTQKVAGEPREELKGIRHSTPMMSLKAVYEEEEIRDFVEQCRKRLDEEQVEFVTEPKYDGLSIELVYEDGRLITAATRGDGETGEDVTATVRTIGGVPLALSGDDPPSPLVVRGEIYMRIAEFNALNERREKRGEQPFANPRNAAAGSIRQLDPRVTQRRPLHLFAYEIPEPTDGGPKTHWETLKLLAAWGLPVDRERQHLITTADQALERYRELSETRDALDFEIDGMVVKVNDLKQRERLGVRSRDPRWALACKFEPRRDTTKVRDIVVNVGGTGALTPVALLEPVHIGGVQVSRASLHNLSLVEKKDIRIGDAVLVERAGDVIPYVVQSLPDRRDGSEKPFSMPESCPVCGGEVFLSEDHKNARCTNLDCPAQLRERIQRFASRRGLDIEGLGEKRARQLVEKDMVNGLPDIFRLDKPALLTLPGYADTSAENLLEEIEQAKKTTLSRLLFALGIPLLGTHLAQLLAAHFPNLEALSKADEATLQTIDEIGPEVARGVVSFFADKHNREALKDMRASGLRLENPDHVSGDRKRPLDGLKFVFTGALDRWTRDEAEDLVERNGGRATSGVSSETDFVIAGPGAGAKLEQAERYDIPVLSEKEFLRLLDEHGASVEE